MYRAGIVASLITLLLLASIACSALRIHPTQGNLVSKGPDFQITLFGNENHEDGSQLRLSELSGKPIVLNFWYPSCPPCRIEIPDLESAARRYATDGVLFIGIQSLVLDTAADGQEFVEEFGITYAVGADVGGKILTEYKIIGFPTTVFLNGKHEIVHMWSGILTTEKLDELMTDVLN